MMASARRGPHNAADLMGPFRGPGLLGAGLTCWSISPQQQTRSISYPPSGSSRPPASLRPRRPVRAAASTARPCSAGPTRSAPAAPPAPRSPRTAVSSPASPAARPQPVLPRRQRLQSRPRAMHQQRPHVPVPCLLMPPSRCFPPVEFSRGVSPNPSRYSSRTRLTAPSTPLSISALRLTSRQSAVKAMREKTPTYCRNK